MAIDGCFTTLNTWQLVNLIIISMKKPLIKWVKLYGTCQAFNIYAVSDYLVRKVERLAARETDYIFFFLSGVSEDQTAANRGI